MTDMKLPQPSPNGDSLTYWAAAREKRLVIRRCKTCSAHHFMPRHLCPKCWSDDLEWVDCTGLGRVHSFSIVHRAPTPNFAAMAPYVIALIDLDEGPRMFTNVVGEHARRVSIGDRVAVVFEDRGEDVTLPQFTPVAEQT
jgi:uncharacterized OB-fold protein